MRWRTAATAAVGVVAAIGLSAHKAGADPSTEPPTATKSSLVSDKDRERLAEAGAALEDAKSRPPGDGPVRTEPKPLALTEITQPPPPAPGDTHAAVAPIRAVVATLPSRPSGSESDRFARAFRTTPIQGVSSPLPPPVPAPVDKPARKPPSPTPPAANATLNLERSAAPKATPPTSVAPAERRLEWYPAWAIEIADQRIAEKWGNAPVRGPPPSAADALGNDARNTTTQVAVVRGPSGFSVAIASQSATVHNVGVAEADGGGGGSATATGNRSDTQITQVTVIVLRGTGTATVEQEANVDNVGVAHATTAGVGNATAVGNDSTTSVTQVAVVYIEGSGDAHVTQRSDVDNVGVASASGTDRDATAVGNQSSTDVTQIAVVRVYDEDVTVGQTSTDRNTGVATAIGGTATGNTATNTTTQVARH